MKKRQYPVVRKVCPPSGPGKRVDYGIYHGDDLVGLIIRCKSAWKILKVKRGARISDPCALKHYTDHFDLVVTFDFLRDAKFFARRSFTSEYLHQLDSAAKPVKERRTCPELEEEVSSSGYPTGRLVTL